MSSEEPARELYRRPGFMIRRMHSISTSIFIQETGELKVTNRQWGILLVLSQRPRIDQISVANLLGLDRSTAGMVLENLEKDGLIVRTVDRTDRRRHNLQLTQSGGKLSRNLPARHDEPRSACWLRLNRANGNYFFSCLRNSRVRSTRRHGFRSKLTLRGESPQVRRSAVIMRRPFDKSSASASHRSSKSPNFRLIHVDTFEDCC